MVHPNFLRRTMMTIDTRLVTKGRGEPLEGLVQQGKVHVTLAKQYAEALIESGWSDEDTSALSLEVSRLEAMGASGGGASGEDEPNAIVEVRRSCGGSGTRSRGRSARRRPRA
jgi:hypothetical protein